MVWDRGTRDLLPFLAIAPEEIGEPEAEPYGPSETGEGSPPPSPQETHQPAALPATEGEVEASLAVSLVGSYQSPAIAGIHVPQVPSGSGMGGHGVELPQIHGFSGHLSSLPDPSLPAAGRSDHHDGLEKQPEHGGGNRLDPADHGAGDLADAPDDGHTIRVTQFAEVDQDASIIVQGYVGEVVARLHIDQDLMMDQDVDIAFTIDGDGHFSVLLDQDMRILQALDIDVDIRDTDGVLFIDVFLRDSVEVEQDTTLDMHIGDGPQGGMVEVNQDLELDQDVDIDIDIEDDLEERYIIKVAVETTQQVDADQDAVVDITDADGWIDMDVDATQTVAVDQETIVRADFTLA
ncbi:hypothetical protein EET67_03030 [Pseudaminobacter arsenicus]|uniref:Uncharacterized protein n=1 Tax=Borborobacter arsenicus TaxID=1851146 RepID=A0A432VCN1_9HYPH|nr:hypothetical protein [Pseudaminobacter arsenicus]RUM99873.1 hypothetical protein EET67_03030 [Pseudaminobacter arsenicus]